jgi:hypothetical protein
MSDEAKARKVERQRDLYEARRGAKIWLTPSRIDYSEWHPDLRAAAKGYVPMKQPYRPGAQPRPPIIKFSWEWPNEQGRAVA